MLKHITDDEVQSFIDDKDRCRIEIIQHIYSCEICKARVEAYQLLIKGIKQQPQPYFDFNLSEPVLQQLPSKTTETSKETSLSWIFISIGILIIAVGSYFFRDYFTALFKGFGTTILIYLTGVTVLTVLGWLFIDLYKRYNREMKLLDAY